MSDPALPRVVPARPRPAAAAARVALIVALLASAAGAFAYLRGWLTPGALTPARFVDEFERVNGVHPGFRRNHAKGLGAAGFFEANGQGVRLSAAAVFRPGRSAVIGRFSLSGGQPFAADSPATVRGLGLQFSPPGGGIWRTAMIDLPIFPVRTPGAFYELLGASAPDPATGKPDPEKMAAFLARHPDAARAAEALRNRTVSPGFADSTFHGLNAFRFTDAAGASTPVRWLLAPEQPAGPGPAAAPGPNYLFDALIARARGGPLRWRLVVVVGRPGDPTDDATVAWPEGRERVDVGTLTLDRVEAEESSPATALNFDPLVLPPGISPSDDPLLSARSALYSQSFTRRAGEVKPPSAVTPAEVEGRK